MSSTGIDCTPIVLRICYAMCGTDIGYAATQARHRLAPSSTDVAYGATSGPLLQLLVDARTQVSLSSYAMSGTDLAYPATGTDLAYPALCPMLYPLRGVRYRHSVSCHAICGTGIAQIFTGSRTVLTGIWAICPFHLIHALYSQG
eukprot:3319277-Rhodomonas_salina.2